MYASLPSCLLVETTNSLSASSSIIQEVPSSSRERASLCTVLPRARHCRRLTSIGREKSKGGLELFQKDTNKRQRSPGLFGSASARRHDWDVVLTTAARQALTSNQCDSTLMVPELHHPPVWISSTTSETLQKVPYHHHEALSIGICV